MITGTVARRVMLAFTVLLLPVVLGLQVPAAHAALALPGGRANFVMSVMLDETTANTTSWDRVSYLIFHTDGTITEEYWFWNITGAPTTENDMNGITKLPFTTAGCPRGNCGVYGQTKFTSSATTRTGTFSYPASGQVLITYASGVSERYSFASVSGWALTRLTLVGSSYTGGVARGVGYGSNGSFAGGAGVTNTALASFVNAGNDLWGYDVQAAYKASTAYNSNIFTYPSAAQRIVTAGQNTACTQSPCMQKTSGSSNWVISPATYGRRVFWQQANSTLTGGNACWTPGVTGPAGHTYSLLQVLDDTNHFYGLVGSDVAKTVNTSSGDWVGILLAVPNSTTTLG
jgi:hypothetical protein